MRRFPDESKDPYAHRNFRCWDFLLLAALRMPRQHDGCSDGAGAPADRASGCSAYGSRSTASAAATRRSQRCAGSPSTYSNSTAGWSRVSSSPRGCTRSPAGCCGSPPTSGCSPSPTGWTCPEQVVALRAMGCTHGQGMAFSGPLDEYRLRRALSPAAIRCRTDRPSPRSRAAVRGVHRVQVCPLSSEAEQPSAHIMRLPSHPLDSRCVPGGGSTPCAPEFSYLESASADAGDRFRTDPELPATRTRRAPLACLTARGVFCCTNPPAPSSGQQREPHKTQQKPSASRRECR